MNAIVKSDPLTLESIQSRLAMLAKKAVQLFAKKPVNNVVGFGIHTTAFLRLRRMAINPDGSIAWERDWKRNLILDAGLDMVAVNRWAQCTAFCHIGTGTNPFQRDSGTTTISVSSLVATASAGYFEAADVGRLLKLDSGEEYYIASYTDTTHVNLVAGPDAAASEGTVWYVNRTVLQTEVKRTQTCRTSTGDNLTSYDGVLRQFTHRRSHLFTAEVGAVTYREIGWGPADNTLLFSGLVLSGGGDALVAGQQYMVISELVFTPTPTISTPAPDIATGGWNSEGDICIETYGSNLGEWAQVSTSGATTAPGASTAFTMEPADAAGFVSIWAINANFTLVSPMALTAQNAAGANVTMGFVGSYAPASFTRVKGVVFGVSSANFAWYGCCIGTNVHRVCTVKFDATQTKDNVHTVTVRFTQTWQRTLVN